MPDLEGSRGNGRSAVYQPDLAVGRGFQRDCRYRFYHHQEYGVTPRAHSKLKKSEIARMLGGGKAAEKHAEEMLAGK